MFKSIHVLHSLVRNSITLYCPATQYQWQCSTSWFNSVLFHIENGLTIQRSNLSHLHFIFLDELSTAGGLYAESELKGIPLGFHVSSFCCLPRGLNTCSLSSSDRSNVGYTANSTLTCYNYTRQFFSIPDKLKRW